MSWTLGMPQGRMKIGQAIRVTDGILEADLRYQRNAEGKEIWLDEKGRRLKWQPTHWRPVKDYGAAQSMNELL